MPAADVSDGDAADEPAGGDVREGDSVHRSSVRGGSGERVSWVATVGGDGAVAGHADYASYADEGETLRQSRRSGVRSSLQDRIGVNQAALKLLKRSLAERRGQFEEYESEDKKVKV